LSSSLAPSPAGEGWGEEVLDKCPFLHFHIISPRRIGLLVATIK